MALNILFLGHVARGPASVQQLLRHLLTQVGVEVTGGVARERIREVHIAAPSILMRTEFFRTWLPRALSTDGAGERAPGAVALRHQAHQNYRYGVQNLIAGKDHVHAQIDSQGLTLRRAQHMSPWLIVLSELYHALASDTDPWLFWAPHDVSTAAIAHHVMGVGYPVRDAPTDEGLDALWHRLDRMLTTAERPISFYRTNVPWSQQRVLLGYLTWGPGDAWRTLQERIRKTGRVRKEGGKIVIKRTGLAIAPKPGISPAEAGQHIAQCLTAGGPTCTIAELLALAPASLSYDEEGHLVINSWRWEKACDEHVRVRWASDLGTRTRNLLLKEILELAEPDATVKCGWQRHGVGTGLVMGVEARRPLDLAALQEQRQIAQQLTKEGPIRYKEIR